MGTEGGLHLMSWLRFMTGSRLAPFVPMPSHVARALLKLADVGHGDVLYDLGCGDGRVLKQALDMGAERAVGYELNAELAEAARRNTAQYGGRAEVRESDANEATLDDASVVTLYLSELGNAKLLPLLERSLSPNARVASFSFVIPGRKHTASTRVDGIDLYLYKL